MPKAKVINNIKHDGVTYQKGDTFEGDAETIAALVAAGALRGKGAPEAEVDDVDGQVLIADAQAEATKLVDDAKAQAEQIVADAKADAETITTAATEAATATSADAQTKADETLKAAKEAGEKIVADAKAKATAK